jgi:hypothetical protein
MIQVNMQGLVRSLSTVEFLRVVRRFTRNTCTVARSIYHCHSVHLIDQLAGVRKYFPERAECEGLRAIIQDRELSIIVGVIAGKVYTLRLLDAHLMALYEQEGVATRQGTLTDGNWSNHPKLSLSGEHHRRIKLDLMRDCAVEMQIGCREAEKAVRRCLTEQRPGILRPDTPWALSVPLALPALPNRRPFRVKVLQLSAL